MYSTITWSEFEEIYKPIKNKFDTDTFAFDTHGEQGDFVAEQDPKYVWTEVDGEGGYYIINGYHYVNRIQYFVCENPSNIDKYLEVVSAVYRDCPNAVEGECERDCPDCEGDGNKTIWIDTREELVEVFGEEYANEVC